MFAADRLAPARSSAISSGVSGPGLAGLGAAGVVVFGS